MTNDSRLRSTSGKAAIIVAGGTGTRMMAKTAKQFLPLAGKPVIVHTIEAFRTFDPTMGFVLVLFKGLEKQWRDIAEEWLATPSEITVVEGGAERFHSVRNGLDAVDVAVDLVAIHDAVRPLVSQGTIGRCFEAARRFGAAIPVVPVVDTIRRMTGKAGITLPRHELVAVQTPQCFQREPIVEAYRTDFQPYFTDDASVAEFAGMSIATVEGNRTNLKITTPEDILIAEALLGNQP